MFCNKPDSTEVCIRSGNNSNYLLYWGIFIVAISILCLCYVGILSYILYKTVLEVEIEADKFNFFRQSKFSDINARAKLSTEKSSFLKKQGLLYTGALFIVWIFVLIFYVVWLLKGPDYVAYLLLSIFYPVQGILNCIIYSLPKELSKPNRATDLSKDRMIKVRKDLEDKEEPVDIEEESKIDQILASSKR